VDVRIAVNVSYPSREFPNAALIYNCRKCRNMGLHIDSKDQEVTMPWLISPYFLL